MSTLLNANFWKKSYLLEFKIDGVLTDAFTFSVPPEQESFSFPQRKSETKTFGGIVVADYGNDAVTIKLSGSTINEELKLIYKSSLGTANLTGSEEIFYLRDLLKKYGSKDKLQKKEVYLYSLNGGESGVRNNPKWWQIYVSNLEIHRSKEKPFVYNYNFEAIGAPEVTRKNKYNFTKKNLGFSLDFLNSEDGFLGVIKKFSEKLKSYNQMIIDYGASFISELYNAIEMANSLVDVFQGTCESYANVVKFSADSTSDLVKEHIGVGDKTISTVTRFVPTLTADVWNSCVNMVNSFGEVGKYVSSLPETYNEPYWTQIQELFTTTSNTQEEISEPVPKEDIADADITISNLSLDLANEIKALVCKYLNEQGISIIPGNVETDDEIVLTYGYKTVEINDAETSWDQLAQKYYGDSNLSYIIAIYNNLPADKKLKSGMKILIPQLDMAANTSSDNEVYNVPDVKDNYGKDLKVDSVKKDFVIKNGDIELVGGEDNLQQALLARYSTEIGSRVRLEIYGIQTAIGDATRASSALIQASVNQTTMEDPRVESIEEINFTGKGDNLDINVVYTDINGTVKTFGGNI